MSNDYFMVLKSTLLMRNSADRLDLRVAVRYQDNELLLRDSRASRCLTGMKIGMCRGGRS